MVETSFYFVFIHDGFQLVLRFYGVKLTGTHKITGNRLFLAAFFDS